MKVTIVKENGEKSTIDTVAGIFITDVSAAILVSNNHSATEYQRESARLTLVDIGTQWPTTVTVDKIRGR